MDVKTITIAKNIIIGILAHAFVKKSNDLKSIAHTSVTECNEY